VDRTGGASPEPTAARVRSDAGATGVTAGDGVGSEQSGGRVPLLTKTPANPPVSVNGNGDAVGPDQVPVDPAAALQSVLTARSAAIRSGDRAAWQAGLASVSASQGRAGLASASTSRGRVGLDPASTARIARFRTAQEQFFDRVRTLRPVVWSYRVAKGDPLPAGRRAALGGTAWRADVHLVYQLTAGGPRVDRQQSLTVVRSGGTWLLADDTDGPTGRDVWDLGAIAHAGSDRCLVVGAQARRVQIAQLASECGRSAAVVDTAWGRSWPRRTVLTVPADLDQLAVLLGRTDGSAGGSPEGSAGGSAGGTTKGSAGGSSDATADTAGLARTAAVTIGPSGAAADGVLINGTAFDDLSAIGRRVVLTHELVHVATRATGSASAPTWLTEGYADHVAYASTGLSAEQVAGDALAAVRAGRVPTGLPAPDDFNAAGDQAAAAYGQSWVAVGVIAGKAGTSARLKAFYQQAGATGSEADLAAALTALGLGGTTGFVPLWQARLRTLAK
jgi:hypothetical protein